MTDEYRTIQKTPWGHYIILDSGTDYKVKRLIIKPGQMTSYQTHAQRSEHWITIKGKGLVILDEQAVVLVPDTQVGIKQGAKHRIINAGQYSDLILIEVQYGICDEDDIIRLDDKYERDDDG